MAIARDFKPSAIPNPATTNGGGPDPRRSLRLLLGLLGAAPGADAEGPVEEHPVGDGLRHEGDEEPHHRVHPVRRAPRLVPDAADGGAGVRLRRRRQEGGLPDGRQLRRHLNGHLALHVDAFALVLDIQASRELIDIAGKKEKKNE